MTGLEQVTAIATAISTGIIAIGMIVLVLIAVPVALKLKKAEEQLRAASERAGVRLAPVLQRLVEIAEDIGALAKIARTDADTISDTVNAANDTVRDAVALTEQRLGEFNALLSVVQEEAEGLFVSSASAVRGVRGGAAAFGRRRGTDLASEELDAADPADDLEFQEESDVDDDSPESTAEARPPAPRVRPRARSRRRA